MQQLPGGSLCTHACCLAQVASISDNAFQYKSLPVSFHHRGTSAGEVNRDVALKPLARGILTGMQHPARLAAQYASHQTQLGLESACPLQGCIGQHDLDTALHICV